ncbi:hypothetical protein [Helicobacter bilis]|nr:hypothetical protein [Helicobacter bilis]
MAETILHKTRSKKDTQGNLVTEITETRIKNREKRISLCCFILKLIHI